ncbi:hypothetical protein EDC02_0953 [Micromonospora sp. Llam0]|uniref:hypothetical protein n=1 Tax=Micromonospora sp. Llam0 TaxID=2485143 RepID=UPI000F46A251|nr:hypothetical protein [Micromonospora sp. Llam0]ROO59165.1 hypothetical protein EDC02_0953 [Micromonospora sp. Llam0]
MTAEPAGRVPRDLLLRHLSTWVPAALRQARRATFVQAYQGPAGATADAALRAVADHPELVTGRHLTVVTVTSSGAEADPTGLPAAVTAHLLPGGPELLPVAVTAAAAANAPLLCHLDLAGGPLPGPAVWRASTAGRPAELLVVGAASSAELHPALTAAGFPLVSVVELVPAGAAGQVDGGTSYPVAFATGSGKRIEAFKEALWEVGPAGWGLRTADDPQATAVAGQEPDHGLAALQDRLYAHLIECGSRTVAELRSFTVTGTVHRAADANRALAGLLAADQVRRRPADGRLAGDVEITPTAPAAGGRTPSTA